MAKFRKIVVENKNFTWCYVANGKAFIKDENGKSYKAFENDKEQSVIVTPKTVAKWITEHIFHKPFVEKENIPVKTVKNKQVRKPKEYIYIVEYNTVWFDSWANCYKNEIETKGYFKNPQDAIDFAKKLNDNLPIEIIDKNKKLLEYYYRSNTIDCFIEKATYKEVELQ